MTYQRKKVEGIMDERKGPSKNNGKELKYRERKQFFYNFQTLHSLYSFVVLFILVLWYNFNYQYHFVSQKEKARGPFSFIKLSKGFPFKRRKKKDRKTGKGRQKEPEETGVM